MIPRHAHESAFLALVIEGGYQEYYDSRSRQCLPSELIFHPAGEVHSEKHYDAVVRIFNVEPARQLLGEIRDYAGVLNGPQVFQAGPLVRLTARLFAEFQGNDSLAQLAMEGLALELLVGVCRRSDARGDSNPPKWLRRASDILNDRFAESVGLADLAHEVGVHPAHLARTFRRYYRCTPGDYLRAIRIKRAQQLLSTTKASLAQVALSVGFADQSHFTANFKRHTGLTPAAYRNDSTCAQNRRNAQL